MRSRLRRSRQTSSSSRPGCRATRGCSTSVAASPSAARTPRCCSWSSRARAGGRQAPRAVGRGTPQDVAFDDADAAAALARPGVVHLPNVFDPSELAGVVPTELEGVNVALTGQPDARKNLLVQTAGFARARADDWTLHLFGQTLRRSGYARWLELAGIPYVEHGFLPRDEYLGLAAGMDAALCASLAESFGFAAAEFVELGVPAVVSPVVASVGGGPLTVRDPGSVDAVAAALEQAVSERGRVEAQREVLRARALANRSVAQAVIERLR